MLPATSFSRLLRPKAGRLAFATGLALLILAETAGRDVPPVPDGARVTLSCEHGQDFILGDLIELTFSLKNTGAESFRFDTGGDYRGTGFPTRYKFTVVDDQGTVLPAESWVGMGGLSGSQELKPGDEYRQLLRLQNYVRLNRAGVFSVRVMHDFGWNATPDKPLPVADAKIKVTMPSAEQARQRVQAVAAAQTPLKENELGRPWHMTDFRFLNDVTFLPALENAAAAGQISALEGINRIESPSTMPALMRLLDSENLDVVNAAALFASRRIPPQVIDGHLRRCGWQSSFAEPDVYSAFWLAEAADPLRKAARKLLRSGKVAFVRTGAAIIEFIGQPDDGAVVLESLGSLMNDWTIRAHPEDNILDAPGAGDALYAALRGLRDRGYRAPAGGTNAILAQFLELADPKVPRRAGWEQTLAAYFDQNPPMLREAAVRALPKPVAGQWEKLLTKALNDEDRGVMYRACEVAGDSGNPVFTEALTNIVRTEQQFFLVVAAGDALTKLGAHWAATEAWIERLAEEKLSFQGLTFLVTKLEHPKTNNGMSGQMASREVRVAIRAKWQLFFSDPDRRALVQAGKPVPVTEAQARDLLGSMLRLELGGGKGWPAANP